MFSPITSCRAVPPGGAPVVAGLTALLTPMRWAAAGVASAMAAAIATGPRAKRRIGGIRQLLEADLHANEPRIAGIGVNRQVRRHDVALQLRDDRDRVVHREGFREADPPVPVV